MPTSLSTPAYLKSPAVSESLTRDSAYNEPPGHAADAFVSEPYDPIEITQLVEEQGSSTR